MGSVDGATTFRAKTKLLKRVLEEPNSGCWLWEGAASGPGYGTIWFDGRTYATHRLSWEVHRGPIPEGLFVLHHCDTPACVNPDHLFVGTQQDNFDDMRSKGRWWRPSGENHHAALITNETAAAIRARYAEGGITQFDVGEEFGVTQGLVNRIVKRRSYKDS